MPTAPPAPLGWSGNWSNQLALGWSALLTQAHRRYPSLSLALGTTAVAPAGANNPTAGGWSVQFTTGRHSWTAAFGMVVWTVGFGQETHFLQSTAHARRVYAGFPFWSSDRLLLPDYGVSPNQPTIVISGGGDGALQDFLRVLTLPSFRSARDLFVACNIPGWVASAIESAEDRAQRAYKWSAGDHDDHVVLETLHKAHANLAQIVAQFPQVRAGLRSVLRAELIVAYLDGQAKVNVIQGKRTESVTGTSHNCTGYAQCHGQEHDVQIVDAPDCWSQPVASPPKKLPPLTANIVVIRHGIDPNTLPQLRLPDISMPRQLPAYHYHR